MSSCIGNGDCIEQCICICFEDEDCEIDSEICTCGHRDHPKLIGGTTEFDVYCNSECPHNCSLVECHNFKFCGKKSSQWELDCENGMCLDCAIHYGKFTFLDINDDCPICLDNKEVIQISCKKHNVCLDCWKTLANTTSAPLKCPLCRESIWK